MQRSLKRAILATAFALGSTMAAHAQSWPSRPITLVVGWPAGGDTDAAARLYADKLTAALRQPVIVDNRPGASGVIAASFVAKAAPDGYTLLYTPSTFTLVQHVLKVSPGIAHDVQRDFTPIIKDQNSPLVLVTGPSSGVRSVSQLVEKARSQDVSYGSPGVGTPQHILAEMFNKAAKVRLSHVPYRGSAPLVADVLGGHVQAGWTTLGVIASHAKSSKLTPLALAEKQRSALLPDVPTFTELGYPTLKFSAWQGLLGPKGLPEPIVQALNKTINQALQMPEVQTKLAALGMEPAGGAPSVLSSQIESDARLYADLTKEFGIKPE